MVPLLATIAGIIAGLIAVACNVFIPRLPQADTPHKRMAYSYIGILVSMMFSVVALMLYWWLFNPSFVWFGVSLCVAYIVGLMVYFLQNVRTLKRNLGKK
ncbi:MAG: hypothetical protein FWG78_02595 [Coriobacteriia bacterium]|nr:hypothetical protein [Coriobacteriia bacterium]